MKRRGAVAAECRAERCPDRMQTVAIPIYEENTVLDFEPAAGACAARCSRIGAGSIFLAHGWTKLTPHGRHDEVFPGSDFQAGWPC